MEPIKEKDETLDTFYHGRILILQKKAGYRFSVDAPLLADFIRPRPDDELLELGTGSGIISLLLSIKSFRRIIALEVQPSLASLAERNVRLNHLEDKIRILSQDLRNYSPGKKFDGIFSNPPYFKMASGHLSPSQEKSIARHELKCSLSDVMGKTAELLNPEGRAWFVFAENRREDFLSGAAGAGLFVRRERKILPRAGDSPNLFLAECTLNTEKTVELPPLILYDEEGLYTDEARQIFAGRIHA